MGGDNAALGDEDASSLPIEAQVTVLHTEVEDSGETKIEGATGDSVPTPSQVSGMDMELITWDSGCGLPAGSK